MKRGAFKQMREAARQQCGGNRVKENELIVSTFREAIESGEFDHNKVSIKELFEGLVDMPEDINNAVHVAEAVASSAFNTITTMLTHSILIEPYDVRMEDLSGLVTESDAVITDPETITGMTPVGGIRRRVENESYTETDFSDKKVMIYKSDFGRMISLTMEDLFNDRTGMIREKAQGIGEDAASHREQMIMETLEVLPRTAFNETASLAFQYKGVAYTQDQFYSTDHRAIDGVMNCNKTTGAGITEAQLTKAFLNFASMVDERGKKITIRPETIIVNSVNELTLATVLATDKAVGSANNDVNQFGPRGKVKMNTVVSPFLSMTPGLFYMGTPRRSMVWLWVEKPNTQVEGANTALAFEKRIVWRSRFNYYGGVGHRDYRWISRNSTV